MSDRLYSACQVAELLGATQARVMEWMHQGHLRGHRQPEGTIRFSEEAICQFLKSRGQEFQHVLAGDFARAAEADAGPAIPDGGFDAPTPPTPAPNPTSEATPDGYYSAQPPPAAINADGLAAEERAALETVTWQDVGADGYPDGADARPAEADENPAGDEPHAQQPDPDPPGQWQPQRPSADTDAEPQAETDADPPPAEPAATQPPASAEANPQPAESAVSPQPPVQTTPPKAPARPPADGDDPALAALERMLRRAMNVGATHLHLHDRGKRLTVAIRLAGAYQRDSSLEGLSNRLSPGALLMAIKRRAEMDISCPRTQTGWLETAQASLAVTSCPSLDGEVLTLELFHSARGGLAEMDLLEADHRLLDEQLRQPNGLILLAGPPRDGTRRLLEAMSCELADAGRHTVRMQRSAGPPHENLDRVPYRPETGMDFAALLRAAVRLDADAVAVGDLPDEEAASAALEAARSGLLVVAGLFVPSAPAALDRMLELDVDPAPLSTALIASVALRAVRGICPDCRQSYRPDPAFLKRLKLDPVDVAFPIQRGPGCAACGQTGYHGQTYLLSNQPIDADVAAAIRMRIDTGRLHDAEWDAGLKTLRQAGLEAVMQGRTTLEELARVLPAGE